MTKKRSFKERKKRIPFFSAVSAIPNFSKASFASSIGFFLQNRARCTRISPEVIFSASWMARTSLCFSSSLKNLIGCCLLMILSRRGNRRASCYQLPLAPPPPKLPPPPEKPPPEDPPPPQLLDDQLLEEPENEDRGEPIRGAGMITSRLEALILALSDGNDRIDRGKDPAFKIPLS